MDEVDRVQEYDRHSYFTHHRSVRYAEAGPRSQSLTTKSAHTQRPTWKPKAQKDTTRDEPPAHHTEDEIVQL